MEALRKAERRDVEAAAMFLLTCHAREAIEKASSEEGLTRDQAYARWAKWLSGPISNGTLDDA